MVAALPFTPVTIDDHEIIVKRLLNNFCLYVERGLEDGAFVDPAELKAKAVQIARYIGAVQAMRAGA